MTAVSEAFSSVQRAVRLGAWLLALLLGLWVIATARYSTDMTAFFPRSPSAEQQLLVDQIREGALSRMLLLGIEGGTAEQRADASVALAQWLRDSDAVEGAINGDAVSRDRDGAFLLRHRYMLSPRTTPERFSAEGLQRGLSDSLGLLASPAGALLKSLLPRDPRAEVVHLLAALAEGAGSTHTEAGVLASADGQRALLMVLLNASGEDLDAQAAALSEISAAFERLRPANTLRLSMTGAPVFAVQSRAIVKRDVERLSLIGTSLVVLLLLSVYRSPRSLLVGLLPVGSGIVAAIAAVGLGFETIHAITIGFGTTLIGESIDYSIYYLVQSRDAQAWRTQFWPTIRLGVATTLCGFGALTLSSFPGLAQLGLYSMAGVTTALLVTRYVLPAIPTPAPPMARLVRIGGQAASVVVVLRRYRWVATAASVAAIAFLMLSTTPLWSRGLAGLNPIPRHLQALDAELRRDLGAGDMNWLVAVRGRTADEALARAEKLGGVLHPLQAEGVVARIDSPSRFLPSQALQQARRASIPAPEVLQGNLAAALKQVPFQAQALAPFLEEAEAARKQPLLTREDLRGTSFALGLSALLLRHGDGHVALLALQPPPEALGDAPAALRAQARLSSALQARVPSLLRQAAAQAGWVDVPGELPTALYIDLQQATQSMFGSYLVQAGQLAAAGIAAVLLLLALTLRKAAGVLRVTMPLAASVLVLMAAHALAGRSLTLLHLVGLMLVVAVGSNYALYFEQAIHVRLTRDGQLDMSEAQRAALASLLLANGSTVIGFGVLAFSQVPVLQAIGATVGPGAVLTLVLSAAWSRSAAEHPA